MPTLWWLGIEAEGGGLQAGVRRGFRITALTCDAGHGGRVPCLGCHLPDGDFKDLVEFALQQGCLDTDRRKVNAGLQESRHLTGPLCKGHYCPKFLAGATVGG